MTLAGLLLAAALLAPADSVATDCPGGRTVTRAELRAAGAGRVGDALRLVAPLTAWTVDGFDAEPRDGRGALALLVDGVPWRSGTAFEPERLDALPVTVSEVEAVVYCPGPRMVQGRLVGGTLDVQTTPPPRLAGLVDYGNETGDPGPARYLDQTLPNQDHWGPDAELVARAGRVWASIRARSFLPTDTSIVARTTRVSARFPEHQTLATTVAARGDVGTLRLTSWASGELPYLPFAQREVALRRTALRGVGTARLGSLDLAAWGGVQRLGAPPWAAPAEVVPPATDWRETSGTVVVGIPYGSGDRAGVRVEATHARGDERLPADDAPILQARALAASATVWAQAAYGRFDVASEIGTATSPTDGFVPVTSLLARLRLGRAFVLTTSSRTQPPALAPDVGYWYAAGLAPLVRTGGPVADVATRALDLRLDARPASRALAGGRLDFGAALIAGRYQSPELVAVAGEAPVTVPWQRSSAELTADAAWSDGRWTLRTDAALAATASDPGAWPEPPTVRGGAGVQWQPDRTLALHARAEATTASRSRAALSGPTRVPGGVVLDLAVRRSVWGDRLALALVGHNVLNAPEQPSAVGARLGPRLFGRLMVRL